MGKGVVSCFLIAFIISCTSIKEDRRECPCWFSVDFSKVSHDIENIHLWLFDEDGELLKRDTLSVPDYNNVCEIELKRGTVGFYVWGNISGDTEINKPFSRGASLKIVKDSSHADCLFRYSNLLDTSGEEGYDTVWMHKEHLNLEIVLEGGTVAGEEFFIQLYCGTSGRYLDGGFTNTGNIVRTKLESKNGNYAANFRIWRQRSLEELKMSIFSKGTNSSCIVEEFRLGEYILKSGYDMSEEELKDLKVLLDISSDRIIIETDKWQIVMPVKIEL